MNSPSTHQLLVRDRQNLDSVARHLRRDDHVFFGAVCAPELVPVVLDYLREKSEKDIPAPIHPTTAHVARGNAEKADGTHPASGSPESGGGGGAP